MKRSLAGVIVVALWLLTACGGTSDASAPPPAESAVAEPIVREAECAFPERMQAGRAAPVRFTIFTDGNAPNPVPGASAQAETMQLPNRSDAEIWVAVRLDVNGQPVALDDSPAFQRLSEQRNVWLWQIVPPDAATIVLQPRVDVEFRDAAGNVLGRQADAWTQTYAVENITGSGSLGVVAAWLGDSLSQLVSGLLGSALMTLVVRPARKRFGPRQAA